MKTREYVEFSLFAYPEYESLVRVFVMAVDQAQDGKGKERHANDEPFQEQKIVTINKQIGSSHGCLFQAAKKAIEAARLEPEAAIKELLGAINYLAAAVIITHDKINKEKTL